MLHLYWFPPEVIRGWQPYVLRVLVQPVPLDSCTQTLDWTSSRLVRVCA